MTTENVNNPYGTLNPDKDSFILVKFLGQGSAMFQVLPANVSAAQLMMVGKILQLQGEQKMNESHLKALIQEFRDENKPPDLVVAKGRVLRTDAK